MGHSLNICLDCVARDRPLGFPRQARWGARSPVLSGSGRRAGPLVVFMVSRPVRRVSEMKHRIFLVAFVVALVSVGTGRADPTFIESRLYLRAEAQVHPDPVQWRVDDRYTTGGYYDESASVTASSSTSSGTAIALASASMSWESTAKGRVTFDNVGFVQAI